MSKLVMTPSPGERMLRYVGDWVRFSLRPDDISVIKGGWQAFLRTNLGRASAAREEVLAAVRQDRAITPTSWRDIPLVAHGKEWTIDIPLTEVGYFRAKPYAIDARGWQHWPDGPDAGVGVIPCDYRTGNTIYCAFPRLFGDREASAGSAVSITDARPEDLNTHGFTVIPPSGKLRDLTRALDHVFDVLCCRILHLLPVNPTPTVYARFGAYGSPYASLDLTAVDPALVEFDRRTTGIDQFRELTFAAHKRGGRVFLDIVINHTGWGSVLQENHPGWFMRQPDGCFASPGAWGTTWEDLVELDHRRAALREEIAQTCLEWCRRGVDGFRCDAGYKVPMQVWQYVTAVVRQEFPETVFLLEGLGGAWELTEALLTEGGLQWAYSELFQNCDGPQVAAYLDHVIRRANSLGPLVHYSETHDNNRLAARSKDWSLLRNRLCALTSVSGCYGFTCGVEWLATEKIEVHSRGDLNWNNSDNLVTELARLNRLLSEHPCFFDGVQLTRLSPLHSPVYALRRASGEGHDSVLVLVNTDIEREHTISLEKAQFSGWGTQEPAAPTLAGWVDLLEQPPPHVQLTATGQVRFRLAPGAAHCLAPRTTPLGLKGDEYRRIKAKEAMALEALGKVTPLERVGRIDPRTLAEWLDADTEGYLSALTYLRSSTASEGILEALRASSIEYTRVVSWRPEDRNRIVLLPPGHWLLVRDDSPFRAALQMRANPCPVRVQSVALRRGHIACFGPFEADAAGDATLDLERYAPENGRVTAGLRLLSQRPKIEPGLSRKPVDELVLLANGRGGMSRLCINLGSVTSKYDCLLGANLHPSAPVDRHVLAKRMRVWINADGFISQLNADCLHSFAPGPPAKWAFIASAGDQRAVGVSLVVDLVRDQNTVVARFERFSPLPPGYKELPGHCDARLTVRVDLEDRNFHCETKRNGAADHHFSTHVRPLQNEAGFDFSPAPDRELRVFADLGRYYQQPEWCQHLPHPVEASRGMVPDGDAFSPGWFDLPLSSNRAVTLVATAEQGIAGHAGLEDFAAKRVSLSKKAEQKARVPDCDAFGLALCRAAQAFVVRRGKSKTIVAGYPWFLDWGRDSLICSRGLIQAGMENEVLELIKTFGGLEESGTMPNTLQGESVSNRDTSDAPLWYGLACEELAAAMLPNAGTPGVRVRRSLYESGVDRAGRTVSDVLRSIAVSYISGTPNGIRVDHATGLVWSPSHFTWMDTNHPAATPREGYPVEVQVLWIRLLRQLARLSTPPLQEPWEVIAKRAEASFEKLFWLADRSYYSDVLCAARGAPAAAAQADDALRSNQLFAVSLGLVRGERARRSVQASLRHLLVPGAVRSLAPLPVARPLEVRAPDGHLLNDPRRPYWGRYEGDEDTRRKPAYHNGTAWTWMLPVLCEALARAWDFAPGAVAAAKAYLGSVDRLLAAGCVGQLPEILDGDAPHQQRGCDAQAWSVTETLRVWRLLNSISLGK